MSKKCAKSQKNEIKTAFSATEDEKKQYLQSVFETTYLKDVIERNHLRMEDFLLKPNVLD